MGGGEVVVQEADQLGELLREVVGALGRLGAAQRRRGGRVGARRAAEAEVDPAGGQRVEGAELLGDHQRRVVGQHHPARTQPYAPGVRGEVGQDDGRGGTGDPGHRVVLGHPVALEAARLGEPGQLGGRAQRVGGGQTAADGGQVQHGQRDGGAAERRRPDLLRLLPLVTHVGSPPGSFGRDCGRPRTGSFTNGVVQERVVQGPRPEEPEIPSVYSQIMPARASRGGRCGSIHSPGGSRPPMADDGR